LLLFSAICTMLFPGWFTRLFPWKRRKVDPNQAKMKDAADKAAKTAETAIKAAEAAKKAAETAEAKAVEAEAKTADAEEAAELAITAANQWYQASAVAEELQKILNQFLGAKAYTVVSRATVDRVAAQLPQQRNAAAEAEANARQYVRRADADAARAVTLAGEIEDCAKTATRSADVAETKAAETRQYAGEAGGYVSAAKLEPNAEAASLAKAAMEAAERARKAAEQAKGAAEQAKDAAERIRRKAEETERNAGQAVSATDPRKLEEYAANVENTARAAEEAAKIAEMDAATAVTETGIAQDNLVTAKDNANTMAQTTDKAQTDEEKKS
jgi:trimeric autotransporter adhesin